MPRRAGKTVLQTVESRNQKFAALANPLDRSIVNDTTRKRCTKCGWERYLRSFPRNWSRPDGRGSWCVDCQRENYEKRKQSRATVTVHP